MSLKRQPSRSGRSSGGRLVDAGLVADRNWPRAGQRVDMAAFHLDSLAADRGSLRPRRSREFCDGPAIESHLFGRSSCLRSVGFRWSLPSILRYTNSASNCFGYT